MGCRSASYTRGATMLGPGPSSRRAGGRNGESGSGVTKTVYQRSRDGSRGVTNLMRAGVAGGTAFVTFQTSFSDLNAAITRVTDLSLSMPLSVPVSTATCQDGKYNSSTRTDSPPA